MTIFLAAGAVLFMHALGVLRIGSMRLTPYGLCAAAGLVLAMALSRRCGRLLGLDPERVWDAGLFAIVSCFVASRLLLVLFDVKAFLHYPLLVLELPSLTWLGMALAAVMVVIYLRRKGISVLSMLDVFAAPAAVLAAFLEMGHALDGSELGMPMSFKADGDVARLHPVSIYGMVASVLVALVLWRVLLLKLAPGATAALGLMLGGFAAFGLDTLTQPSVLFDGWWLEPGQIVALGSMMAGALLWTLRPSRTDALAPAGEREIPQPMHEARLEAR